MADGISREPVRERGTIDSIVQDQEESGTIADQKGENLDPPSDDSKINDSSSLSNNNNNSKSKPSSAIVAPLPSHHPTETTSEDDPLLFDPAAIVDALDLPDIDDDQALLAALASLQVDDDQQQQEDFQTVPYEQGQVLEELQVDPADRELLSLQDFSDVFQQEQEQALQVDDNDALALLQENLNYLSIGAQEQQQQQQQGDPEIMQQQQQQQENDDDRNFLLGDMVCIPCEPSADYQYFQQLSEEEQLQLTLMAMAQEEGPFLQQQQQQQQPKEDGDGNSPSDDMVCIPCAPGAEDPLSIGYQHFQQLSEEEQLQLSLMAMAQEEGNNEAMDDDQPQDEQEVYDESFQNVIVSRRPQAVEAAIHYTLSFGTGLYQPAPENENPTNERTCYGHKETIYSCKFSDDGKYLVTASQDATVRVWNVATNALLSTLTGHNKDYECLRTTWAPSNWAGSNDGSNGDNEEKASFVASGGADGVVKVWLSSDPSTPNSWECVSTLDHGKFEARPPPSTTQDGQVDVPQIYALQFIDHWQGLASAKDTNDKNSFLLTSSDDYVHLWDMDTKQEVGSSEIKFSEVFSIRFTASENVGGGVSVCNVTSGGLQVPGQQQQQQQQQPDQPMSSSDGKVAFGGERNPENTIYVFDASYCPGNGLLGVALADGSLRLVNGRGICVSILSLPGCNSHLTSFTWDSTGSRLASCVATGHLILWNIHGNDENGKAAISCAAVLEGGHIQGRPLFGAKYCGVDNEDLIVSWGVDGRLCLWDSESHGQVHAPISTLLARPDYPIYAVDITTSPTNDKDILSRLAVGGGGEPGFMGLPLYLYDVKRTTGEYEQPTDAPAVAE